MDFNATKDLVSLTADSFSVVGGAVAGILFFKNLADLTFEAIKKNLTMTKVEISYIETLGVNEFHLLFTFSTSNSPFLPVFTSNHPRTYIVHVKPHYISKYLVLALSNRLLPCR